MFNVFRRVKRLEEDLLLVKDNSAWLMHKRFDDRMEIADTKSMVIKNQAMIIESLRNEIKKLHDYLGVEEQQIDATPAQTRLVKKKNAR